MHQTAAEEVYRCVKRSLNGLYSATIVITLWSILYLMQQIMFTPPGFVHILLMFLFFVF